LNTQNYTFLLADPQQITKQALPDLVEVIDTYPYFQSARALWLKGLKNQESFRYNDALKLTAAHTTNRDILFEFITSESFEQDQISLQILSNDQSIGQYDIEIGEDLSQTIDTEQKQEHKQALEDAEAVLDPNLFEKKIADIEQMIAHEARKPAKIPPSDTKKPCPKVQCFSSSKLLVLSNEKLTEFRSLTALGRSHLVRLPFSKQLDQ